MKATRTRHSWVHMFIIHRPTLTVQLHNFDLFRTCRTRSFCTVAWQLARFILTRRIARSLGDSWASCLHPDLDYFQNLTSSYLAKGIQKIQSVLSCKVVHRQTNKGRVKHELDDRSNKLILKLKCHNESTQTTKTITINKIGDISPTWKKTNYTRGLHITNKVRKVYSIEERNQSSMQASDCHWFERA